MAYSRNFREMIEAQWTKGNFACVGLDSLYEKIPMLARRRDPHDTMLGFNSAIIDATKDLVCAYKINSAFYEVHLDVGWKVIRSTIAHIRVVAPDVPVIIDSKRSDIGNSNQEYARSAFDYLLADAVTVNPYLGGETLQEFFSHKEKGVFVLCRTSNPGAEEIQKVPLTNGEPLYRFIAKKTTDWNINKNAGIIVGATCTEELREVRAVVGDMPILVPGIGAQGGDVATVVSAGMDARNSGLIIHSSRNIIFASGGADYAEAARRETLKFRDAIVAAQQRQAKP